MKENDDDKEILAQDVFILGDTTFGACCVDEVIIIIIIFIMITIVTLRAQGAASVQRDCKVLHWSIAVFREPVQRSTS